MLGRAVVATLQQQQPLRLGGAARRASPSACRAPPRRRARGRASAASRPAARTASPTSLLVEPGRPAPARRCASASSALPAGGGSPSATRRTSSASIHSAAGQIATTAATRVAGGAGVDREQAAHARAAHRDPVAVHLRPFGEHAASAPHVVDHARARASPSVSPWPRLSKVSAAKPLLAAARAKSAWFSLREPAPCRTITAGHGRRRRPRG